MSEVDPTTETQPVLRPKRRERISQLADIADSVVIKKEAGARLGNWLKQINERFEGFGVITQNEVADFLFRRHAEELSDEELSAIGSEFYDEVFWLKWALEKITLSKMEGGSLTLNDLVLRRDQVTTLPTQLPSKSAGRSKARVRRENNCVLESAANGESTIIV